ncbi:MAG: hypothetical protein P8J33_03995 [Pirellulaceae bacterium]|nr:hypothetical protein [Pirellulaceae bacterium]
MIAAVNVAPIIFTLQFKRPTQAEFTAGLNAPLLLPGREPIDLDTPNWLVSRFLIRKRRNGELEFGAVAVDMDANRVFFQRSFWLNARKGSFLKGYPLLANYEIDLSEILWARRFRDGEGNRATEIITDQGGGLLPDHASNYQSMSKLLIGISKHTEDLDWIRRPWVQQVLWIVAAFLLIAVILVVSFLLV